MGATLPVRYNVDADVVHRQPKVEEAESYPYLIDYVALNREK